MKTVFFKKLMPIAVFAVGITGAFVTTSMQSAAKAATPEIGYLRDADKHCIFDMEVTCSDVNGPVCLQNITSGPQAYAEDAQGNCTKLTYRP